MSKKPEQTLSVKGVREITISIPKEKIEERDKLIAACATIAAIDSKEAANNAVLAVGPLKLLAREAEKDRKEFKAPILEAGRLIDSTIEAFLKPSQAQVKRIEEALAAFNEKERKAAEAEQKRQAEEAARIERERQAEIARIQAEKEKAEREAAEAAQKGDTQAAAEAARRQEELEQAELAAELAQTEAAPIVHAVAETKISGSSVRVSYDFEVIDIAALYKTHPHLVDLSIRRADTKAFINIPNVDRKAIPGIRVFEATSVSVKASKAAPAIEAGPF